MQARQAESGEVLAGSCAGLKPNVVVYATLVDGFMREGIRTRRLR